MSLALQLNQRVILFKDFTIKTFASLNHLQRAFITRSIIRAMNLQLFICLWIRQGRLWNGCQVLLDCPLHCSLSEPSRWIGKKTSMIPWLPRGSRTVRFQKDSINLFSFLAILLLCRPISSCAKFKQNAPFCETMHCEVENSQARSPSIVWTSCHVNVSCFETECRARYHELKFCTTHFSCAMEFLTSIICTSIYFDKLSGRCAYVYQLFSRVHHVPTINEIVSLFIVILYWKHTSRKVIHWAWEEMIFSLLKQQLLVFYRFTISWIWR